MTFCYDTFNMSQVGYGKLFGGNVGSCPQYGMDWRLHSKAEDRSPYGINCSEDSGFLSSFFFSSIIFTEQTLFQIKFVKKRLLMFKQDFYHSC